MGRAGDWFPVVEANHCNLIRDMDAQFVQSIHCAARELVATAKDRIDRGILLEEIPGSRIAPTFLPGAREDSVLRQRKTMLHKHLAQSLFTQAYRFKIAGSGNMGNIAATSLHKMLSRQACALSIVGPDAESGRIGDLGMSVDHRNRGLADIDRGTRVLAPG